MDREFYVYFHFSGGVGRTGVFIALSIGIERLKVEGTIDLFQAVRQLRTQRPAMVQTIVSSACFVCNYIALNFK